MFSRTFSVTNSFFYAKIMTTNCDPGLKRLRPHAADPTWGHPQTVPQGVASPRPCDTKKRSARALRRGERNGTRDGQHSGPSFFPHESHRELQIRKLVSRFGMVSSICKICTASSLHLPPVSMARTTNLHRRRNKFGVYVASLSWRVWNKTALSWSAACG